MSLICNDCSATNGAFIQRKGASTLCYACYRASLKAQGVSGLLDRRMSRVNEGYSYVAVEPVGRRILNGT